MATGGRQYRVEISSPARKQLDALPRDVRRRIEPRIDALATDPRPRGSDKLTGFAGRYRIRIGHYRVIYDVDDDQLTVLVLKAAHRRDVYRP